MKYKIFKTARFLFTIILLIIISQGLFSCSSLKRSKKCNCPRWSKANENSCIFVFDDKLNIKPEKISQNIDAKI